MCARCAGGEKVLDVFEVKLKDAINKIPFQKILTLKNVQMVVNEADGYQPHIIAPENGYRRLIEDGLSQLREPALVAVEQVHQILKQIVTMAVNTPECRDFARFFNLKQEVIVNAATTLGERARAAAHHGSLVHQPLGLWHTWLQASNKWASASGACAGGP